MADILREGFHQDIHRMSEIGMSTPKEFSREDSMGFFDSYYDLTRPRRLIGPHRTTLPGSVSLRCRFCGRSSPQVSFGQETHVIPALMGNRILFSNFECDDCNQRFGRMEKHLGAFMGLVKTLSLVKGRNGIASFRSRDTTFKIRAKATGEITLECSNGDSRLLHDDENRRFIIGPVEGEPYAPENVYKALTKAAVALLPEEELGNFPQTLQWLLQEQPSNTRSRLAIAKILDPARAGLNRLGLKLRSRPVFRKTPPLLLSWFSVYLDPPGFPYITYLSGRRKNHNDRVPYMIFFIAFAKFSWQIYLPFSSQDYHLSISDLKKLPPFPGTIGTSNIKRYPLDLSDGKIQSGKQSVVLEYEKESPYPP
jgi:hypothetical protein